VTRDNNNNNNNNNRNRRISGAKRDEVTGDWRRLHKEELHILY
jgi:hypothetical protein